MAGAFDRHATVTDQEMGDGAAHGPTEDSNSEHLSGLSLTLPRQGQPIRDPMSLKASLEKRTAMLRDGITQSSSAAAFWRRLQGPG
jgi:hypothetical protein